MNNIPDNGTGNDRIDDIAPEIIKDRKTKRILFRTVFFSWLVVIMTTGIFALSIIPYQKSQLLEEMDTRAKVTYTSIAHMTIASILVKDYSTVVDYCMTIIRENPSILYIMIIRQDGFALIHKKTTWSRKQLGSAWISNSKQYTEKGRIMYSDLVNQEVFHSSFDFTYSGIEWGWIHIGLSPDKFKEDLGILYQRTCVMALLCISIGLVASYIFTRRVSAPILLLEKATRQVAAGDFSARADIKTGDEIENLANSFNYMTAVISKSQEELKSTNKKLVETIRNVGMTEVATGVLHNVGNVLNSVGITASAITDRVRNIKVDTLSKIVGQFMTNRDDLISFLNKDGRDQKLVLLLSGLSDHFVQEQEQLLQELGRLKRHIQHLTEIVSLQQRYSKIVGMEEPILISELIEDAVKINGEALKKYDIELKQHIGDLPPLLLDRRKVLQILSNLINNAKHSLAASEKMDKKIEIIAEKDNDDHIVISVSDNGSGISEENLTRIFSYGYTTKKKGHGFGLHSGALNAKEMGGTLSAKSDGPGKGAVFILELPYKPGSPLNE